MKRHNIIYQTTNTINGKTYIGRHSTDNLDDGYLGSGTILKRAIQKWGKDSFVRIVLFDFPTPEEMIAKEIELLTEEFIDSDDNYNIGIGQGGLFTHDESARQKLREANTGFVVAKDKDGNTFRVSKDDPKYQSGELIHLHCGMVSAKDSNGKKFWVEVDDPRYLSGELVGMNMGRKHDLKKGQRHAQIMTEYWKEVGGHSEEAKEKCRATNAGKITVRDTDGNKFRISVDDPRYLSGELTNAFIGTKLSEETRRKIKESKKGCVWVSNTEMKKTKLVRPEEVDNYISEGWIRYRMFFNKTK